MALTLYDLARIFESSSLCVCFSWQDGASVDRIGRQLAGYGVSWQDRASVDRKVDVRLPEKGDSHSVRLPALHMLQGSGPGR